MFISGRNGLISDRFVVTYAEFVSVGASTSASSDMKQSFMESLLWVRSEYQEEMEGAALF